MKQGLMLDSSTPAHSWLASGLPRRSALCAAAACKEAVGSSPARLAEVMSIVQHVKE